jgi:hypothetical protein
MVKQKQLSKSTDKTTQKSGKRNKAPSSPLPIPDHLPSHPLSKARLLPGRLVPPEARPQPTLPPRLALRLAQFREVPSLIGHRVPRLLEAAERGCIPGMQAAFTLHRRVERRLRSEIALGDLRGREGALGSAGGGGGGDALGIILGPGAGHVAGAHGGLKSSRVSLGW